MSHNQAISKKSHPVAAIGSKLSPKKTGYKEGRNPLVLLIGNIEVKTLGKAIQ